MEDSKEIGKEQFLFPTAKYHGSFTPGNLAFNANLQEFAQKIGYICALESGGKISTKDAYNNIKSLWAELKKSKKFLLDQTTDQEQDPPKE